MEWDTKMGHGDDRQLKVEKLTANRHGRPRNKRKKLRVNNTRRTPARDGPTAGRECSSCRHNDYINRYLWQEKIWASATKHHPIQTRQA
jgi:hypothetical protein